jgi:hypothetical protein
MHVFLCSFISKQITQQEQSSWYPRVIIISCTALCPLPSWVLIFVLPFSPVRFLCFLADSSVADWRCLFFQLQSVSPIFWHCWHLCRHLHTHIKVTLILGCLQLSCFPSQGIQVLYDDKMMCHWQPFVTVVLMCWREDMYSYQYWILCSSVCSINACDQTGIMTCLVQHLCINITTWSKLNLHNINCELHKTNQTRY